MILFGAIADDFTRHFRFGHPRSVASYTRIFDLIPDYRRVPNNVARA